MIAAAVVWRGEIADTVSGWATRLRDLAGAEPGTEADLRSVAGESTAEVAPDLVESLLVVAGAGDQFEWIQGQGSAWKAVLGAIAATPAVADRITSLGTGGVGVADLMVTVAGSEEAILATIPVSGAEAVTGADALVPSPGHAADFVRARFDHLLLRPEGRPRIEVLNGNGQIGATADVAAILVRAGFRIVRTDNADAFDYEDTLVSLRATATSRRHARFSS